MAKALIERGYKIGGSIMLSADEGNEFSVEGNYPCYQIVAGRISKKCFKINWIVGDNRIKGVSRYGVYIAPDATVRNVHTATVSKDIFAILRELKNTVITRGLNSKGETLYLPNNSVSSIWYKIDNTILCNKRISISRLGYQKYYRRKD